MLLTYYKPKNQSYKHYFINVPRSLQVKDKIERIKEIIVEFQKYLETQYKDEQNWKVHLIGIMYENTVETIKKLDKLIVIVDKNPTPSKTVEQHVYAKLMEYIARVKISIQRCQYREKLAYKVENRNYAPTQSARAKLAASELLKDLVKNLDHVLEFFNKPECNLPQKDWLNETWKKADANLNMETALTVLRKESDSTFKAVLFSEKIRFANAKNYVEGKTTKVTNSLTKFLPESEKAIEQEYYHHLSEFEWKVKPNKSKL